MNILLLNWYDLHNPLAGGAERYLFEIFGRLARSGHHITLLCQSFAGCKETETIDDISIVRLPIQGIGLFAKAGMTISQTFMYYLQKNKNFEVIIDCVNKVPYFTPCYVGKKRLSLQHHFNGSTFLIERPKDGWILQKLEKLYFRMVYHSENFVVVSPSTQDELKEYGLAQNRSVIVYNAVDCPNIERKPSAEPLIVYLGRLQKYKSVDVLINSLPAVLAQVPNTRCKIIGSGEDKSRLIALVKSLGISDHVEFMGFVDEATKYRVLSSAWIHVNPSQKEGWGISVFEAARYQVPTICSRVPGLKDAVKDGITGFLFDYGDSHQLANKLNELLLNDQLRSMLGWRAYRNSLEFTWENSMLEMERYLVQVVEAQPAALPEQLVQNLSFPMPF